MRKKRGRGRERGLKAPLWVNTKYRNQLIGAYDNTGVSSIQSLPVSRDTKASMLPPFIDKTKPRAGKLDILFNACNMFKQPDKKDSGKDLYFAEYYGLTIPNSTWPGSSVVEGQVSYDVTTIKHRNEAQEIHALLNERTGFMWTLCYDQMSDNLAFKTRSTILLHDMVTMLQKFRQTISDDEAHCGLMDKVQKFLPILSLYYIMDAMLNRGIFEVDELSFTTEIDKEDAVITMQGVVHNKRINNKPKKLKTFFEKMYDEAILSSYFSIPCMEIQSFQEDREKLDHSIPLPNMEKTPVFSGPTRYTSSGPDMINHLLRSDKKTFSETQLGGRFAALDMLDKSTDSLHDIPQIDPKLNSIIEQFEDTNKKIILLVSIPSPLKQMSISSSSNGTSLRPSEFIASPHKAVHGYRRLIKLSESVKSHPYHKLLPKMHGTLSGIIQAEKSRLKSHLKELMRASQQAKSGSRDDTNVIKDGLDQMKQLRVFETSVNDGTFDLFDPSHPCPDTALRKEKGRAHRHMMLLMLLDNPCQQLIYSQAEFLCQLISIVENRDVITAEDKITDAEKHDGLLLRQLPFRPFAIILSMLGWKVGSQQPRSPDQHTACTIDLYFKDHPHVSWFFKHLMYKHNTTSIISRSYRGLVQRLFMRHSCSPLLFTQPGPVKLDGLPYLDSRHQEQNVTQEEVLHTDGVTSAA